MGSLGTVQNLGKWMNKNTVKRLTWKVSDDPRNVFGPVSSAKGYSRGCQLQLAACRLPVAGCQLGFLSRTKNQNSVAVSLSQPLPELVKVQQCGCCTSEWVAFANSVALSGELAELVS